MRGDKGRGDEGEGAKMKHEVMRGMIIMQISCGKKYNSHHRQEQQTAHTKKQPQQEHL